MKFIASVAAMAAALTAVSASASETSPFAGGYVGVQLGISDLKSSHSDLDYWYDNLRDAKNTDHEVQFGLKAGYDVVHGPIIAGAYAEAQLGTLNSGYEIDPEYPSYEIGSKITTLASLRAKLGLTQDNLAIFATGGVAISDAKHRYQETDESSEYFRNNGRQLGYVVGGGAAYAVSQHSSIGVDYSLYKFSARTHDLLSEDGTPNDARFKLKDSIQSVTASYVVRF